MKRKKLDRENGNKLQRVYLQYRVFLFHNAAFPILKEHALAEDAVQETFTRLIGHVHKINESDERKTRNFLLTVCKHAAIDIYNKRNRLNQASVSQEILEAVPYQGIDLLSSYLDKELRDTLVTKVKTLDPIYQSVFFLRYSHEYTFEEIASILKLEPATVRKRMERIRNKLGYLLEKEVRK